MCEDWYHIGSRAGAVRAQARMRYGASELDARRKVPPACQHGWDADNMRLVDRIANMKGSFHLRYLALDKLQIPSHWAPGLQYFHFPTKFCEDSTV